MHFDGDMYFRTKSKPINSVRNTDNHNESEFYELVGLESSKQPLEGSGWSLHSFDWLQSCFIQHNPLSGSSYID
jgi:hypothetical protein